jgi:hypothetical protein
MCGTERYWARKTFPQFCVYCGEFRFLRLSRPSADGSRGSYLILCNYCLVPPAQGALQCQDLNSVRSALFKTDSSSAERGTSHCLFPEDNDDHDVPKSPVTISVSLVSAEVFFFELKFPVSVLPPQLALQLGGKKEHDWYSRWTPARPCRQMWKAYWKAADGEE